MLQKISKLFVFDIKSALAKVQVMHLISSALKPKHRVKFNCQNFLSGHRVHGCRSIKTQSITLYTLLSW